LLCGAVVACSQHRRELCAQPGVQRVRRAAQRRNHRGGLRMRFAPIVLAMALVAPAAAAPAVDTAGATACHVHGYLTDKDPKGTNVRAAPSANAPIIGHLPASYSEPGSDEDFAVEFTIVGSKNGWMLIRHAKTGMYGDGPEKTIFAGPGW